MHVILFEADHEGHRYPYLRHLLPALTGLPCEITVAISAEGRDSAEFEEHLAPFVTQAHFAPALTRPRGTPLQIARHNLRQLQDVVTTMKPGHVYVPTSDGLTQVLGAMHGMGLCGWLRGIECEAVMHAGGFAFPAHSALDRMKRALGIQAVASAPWRELFFINLLVYEYVQRRGGPLAQRARLLNAPIERAEPHDRATARAALGLPLEGRIAGSAGGQDTRKGIDLLLRAFARAALDPADRLLLAGRLSPDIRALVEGEFRALVRSGRILLIDRYLSVRELELSLAAMDVVCPVYPRHPAVSDIALRAAAAGRIVLGSNVGWIGAVVPRCGLGLTCDVSDPDALARALADALDQSATFSRTATAARLLEFYSPANYAATLSARLRDRLGQPPFAERRTWEWVTAPR